MITKKILIVEDEAIVAMQLEASLKQMGYEIAGVASRGNDAIRIAKDTWPDLILMDIRLEGSMDGIETANTINMYYNIPVIFLTAFSDDTTVSRVIKTSSYGFMTKPFNDRELYSNIELAIGKHRSSQKSQVEESIISSIFSLIPDVVISVNPDGTIRRLNDSAQALWDWDNDDISNHDIFSIMDPGMEDMDSFFDSLNNLKKTKMGLFRWPNNVTVTTAAGEQRQFMLSVEPIRGKEGEFREIFLLLSRAIDRRSSEISEVSTRQVIDIIKDPVFFMDSQYNVVLFNTAFQEFCSLMAPGCELRVNTPVFEILPKNVMGDRDACRELFKNGAPWQEIVDIPNELDTSQCSVTKLPVFNGEAVSHIATIFQHNKKS